MAEIPRPPPTTFQAGSPAAVTDTCFDKGYLEKAFLLVCFPRSRVTAADLDNRCGFSYSCR